MRKKGMTLIESVVAIALLGVIFLLVAPLINSFGKVKSRVHTQKEIDAEFSVVSEFIQKKVKENPNKAQVTARTKHGKRKLREETQKRGLGDTVKEEAEILGVTMVKQGGRKIAENEKKRIQEGRETVRKLAVLPIGRQKRLEMIKAFGISKVGYGWVGREPKKGRWGGSTPRYGGAEEDTLKVQGY